MINYDYSKLLLPTAVDELASLKTDVTWTKKFPEKSGEASVTFVIDFNRLVCEPQTVVFRAESYEEAEIQGWLVGQYLGLRIANTLRNAELSIVELQISSYGGTETEGAAKFVIFTDIVEHGFFHVYVPFRGYRTINEVVRYASSSPYRDAAEFSLDDGDDDKESPYFQARQLPRKEYHRTGVLGVILGEMPALLKEESEHACTWRPH